MCRRCVAALEVCGCAGISAIQRRQGGRGELFHKSLVIISVKKTERFFPMYHSSLTHGLVKLKEKIVFKKQVERAVGSIQRHSYTCIF